MPERHELPTPDQFPAHYTEKLRFSDTDRLGHVNNTIFAKLFESGRVALIYDQGEQITPPDTAFVIVHLVIDFIAEMNWPGEVLIGTKIVKVGRSSIGLEQAIFVAGQCTAKSESVLVVMDENTRRSTDLGSELRARLAALQAPSS